MNTIKVAALILCCGAAALDAMATIIKVDKQRSAHNWHSMTGTFTLSDGRSIVINDLSHSGSRDDMGNDKVFVPVYVNNQLGMHYQFDNEELTMLFNGHGVVINARLWVRLLTIQLEHVNANVYQLSGS